MKDVTLQDATVNATYVESVRVTFPDVSVRVTFPIMELREGKARWFHIMRGVELAKCGFSKDCEGCRVAASGDEVSRLHGMEYQKRIRAAMMCRRGPAKTAAGASRSSTVRSLWWPASAHHSRSDALSALHAMKCRHLVSRRCHTASLAIFGESTLIV